MIEHEPSHLRKIYFEAWQKALQNQLLSPMESIIVDIIQRHPEYHPIFAKSEDFAELMHEKFALDHNPFFHLALHVTIAEQVSADRPPGIRAHYLRLFNKYGDKTETEHQMMECLAKLLVDSFNSNTIVNEHHYLEALEKLCTN